MSKLRTIIYGVRDWGRSEGEGLEFGDNDFVGIDPALAEQALEQYVREVGHWYVKSEQVDARPTYAHYCNCGYKASEREAIDGHVAWKLKELEATNE